MLLQALSLGMYELNSISDDCPIGADKRADASNRIIAI